MEISKFYVEMDNPSLFFFPGDSVTGRVVVHYQKTQQTQGIKVKFTGQAKVSWTERYGRTRDRIFEEKQIYFDEKIHLAGNDGSEVTLPPGRNIFPFDFTLPNKLPSTLVGVFGSITYNMVAVMKRSWKPDKKLTIPFTVNEIVDLNVGAFNTVARAPIEGQKQKNVWCCFKKSGPISFTLKIPRGGFVPGEVMPVTLDLYNNSRKKIVKTEIIFSQEIIYHAQDSVQLQNQILIWKSLSLSVGPGETETWLGNNLQIPAVPPTSCRKTRLIHINYYLWVEVKISEMSSSLKEKFHILIGNVPMENTFGELAALTLNRDGVSDDGGSPPEYNNSHSFPVARSATIFQTYPDLPPPTYAEAVSTAGTTINNEAANSTDARNTSTSQSMELDNFSNNNYVPKYITYG